MKPRYSKIFLFRKAVFQIKDKFRPKTYLLLKNQKFIVISKHWQNGSSPALQKRATFFGLKKSLSKGKMSGLAIFHVQDGCQKNASKKTQAPSNHSLQRQGFQVAWYRRGSCILSLKETHRKAVLSNTVGSKGEILSLNKGHYQPKLLNNTFRFWRANHPKPSTSLHCCYPSKMGNSMTGGP